MHKINLMLNLLLSDVNNLLGQWVEYGYTALGE